jgi:hypothetical protein
MEILSHGSTSSGTVALSSGGIFEPDSSASLARIISELGLPDHLHLSDLAFGSNTTLGFSEDGNKLSEWRLVSDSLHTAQVALLGQFAMAHFTSASDGHGGTPTGDPAIPAASNFTAIATIGQHHV